MIMPNCFLSTVRFVLTRLILEKKKKPRERRGAVQWRYGAGLSEGNSSKLAKYVEQAQITGFT